jgi:hypothetical protein
MAELLASLGKIPIEAEHCKTQSMTSGATKTIASGRIHMQATRGKLESALIFDSRTEDSI